MLEILDYIQCAAACTVDASLWFRSYLILNSLTDFLGLLWARYVLIMKIWLILHIHNPQKVKKKKAESFYIALWHGSAAQLLPRIIKFKRAPPAWFFYEQPMVLVSSIEREPQEILGQKARGRILRKSLPVWA